MPEFREILKRERTARSLSQYELAEAAGVHHSAISLWESGARWPTTQNLARLAAALKVPVDKLVDGKPRRTG
jgi:transcriptional regulator with XRE-family HTH domain